MKRYPLLFTYRDPVIGDGFLAFVEARGRLLVEQEEEGCWVYGVNPGALSAGARGEPKEALVEFRKVYQLALYALAEQAKTFDEFKAEVERLFYQEDEDVSTWEQAVQEIRDSEESVDWVQRGRADDRRKIEVRLLQQTPASNVNPYDSGSVALAVPDTKAA
jgi:hypothetical protein